MSGFNLLHFPTLDRQQSRRRQWRAVWIGVGLGAVLAGSWVQWQLWQTDQLHQSLHELQGQLSERKRQIESRQQQAQKNQVLHQQLTQLARLQSQQQAWTLLQSSVLEEAQSLGLSLQRLHVEAGRIDIQGQAPTAQAMTRAAQRLSERWGQPLHLVSLEASSADTAASAVTFVWQGTWPGVADGVVSLNKAKP